MPLSNFRILILFSIVYKPVSHKINFKNAVLSSTKLWQHTKIQKSLNFANARQK